MEKWRGRFSNRFKARSTRAHKRPYKSCLYKGQLRVYWSQRPRPQISDLHCALTAYSYSGTCTWWHRASEYVALEILLYVVPLVYVSFLLMSHESSCILCQTDQVSDELYENLNLKWHVKWESSIWTHACHSYDVLNA